MSPNDRPAVASFFSGAGGLDIGMARAGFSIRSMCERDAACGRTLAMNCPDVPLLKDVNDVSVDDVRRAVGEDVDVVIGGPPCQAFSTAGRRLGFDDDRGNVMLRFLDLVDGLRPRYVVMENVRGLLSIPHFLVDDGLKRLSAEPEKGGALLYVLKRLGKSGYRATFELYNAANFGAPQIRERLIIIAVRGMEPVPHLQPTHAESGGFGLPPWRTLADALAGMEDVEHHFVRFPEKRLKWYRMLKAGQNWRDIPEGMQREAMGKSYDLGGGKTGFYRRLAWNRPSPTLVTHPAMPATDLAHPELDRPLSIEEYAAIQEFPEDWKICGSLLERYRQLGNAVPIRLGEAVGRAILRHMRGERPRIPENFPFSRYKATSEISWRTVMEPRLRRACRNSLLSAC